VTTDGWLVRAASASDLPELQRIYRAASLSNAGDREALLARPEFLVFAGAGIAPGRTRVAAAPDAGPVGFASTAPGEDGDLELEDLFVDPVWMRRGVGRLLVQDAVRQATAAGARAILVTGNQHALAFYLAVGFVQVGQAQTELRPAPRLRLDLPGPAR
jgi:GNAT superfamily N-acetyltransferase